MRTGRAARELNVREVVSRKVDFTFLHRAQVHVGRPCPLERRGRLELIRMSEKGWGCYRAVIDREGGRLWMMIGGQGSGWCDHWRW